jgi:hypothetical protein
MAAYLQAERQSASSRAPQDVPARLERLDAMEDVFFAHSA